MVWNGDHWQEPPPLTTPEDSKWYFSRGHRGMTLTLMLGLQQTRIDRWYKWLESTRARGGYD